MAVCVRGDNEEEGTGSRLLLGVSRQNKWPRPHTWS